jgi:hypothetical protein
MTFAAQFNQKCPDTWRVANTEDIVNTVPLAAMAVEAFHLDWLSRLIQDLAKVPIIGRDAVDHLGFLNSFFKGVNYQHIGTPVDFTQQNGDILQNHQMTTYLNALTMAKGAAAQ